MTYAEKLKTPKWQRKRLKIYERDNFTCKLCGDSETTLNVHHLKYSANPIETPDADLITLCQHCHKFVEDIKKQEPTLPIHISKQKHHTKNMQVLMGVYENDSIHISLYSDDNKISHLGMPKDILQKLINPILNG